jgi:cyclase
MRQVMHMDSLGRKTVGGRRRTALLMTSAALLGGLLAAPSLRAQENGAGDVRQSPYYHGYDFYAGSADQGTYDDGHLHPWHVQGDVWLIAGEPNHANVAVQLGNDGALVVDAGTAQMAPQLLAAIRGLATRYAGDQKAIRMIVQTDGEPDHIGGTELLRNGGDTIVGGNFQFDNPGLTAGATVIGSLNLLTRMVTPNAQGQPGAPQGLWPNETHTEDLFSVDFNDEAVSLHHPHNATSDSNEMVMFRRADVVATGDVLNMDSYPIIDVKSGGTIDGELAALNQIIELAVADRHNGPQEGGTMVIPGHGRLCDQSEVIEYTIILTTIRNRVMYYKNRGRTLQQVLALQPSGDTDRRWAPRAPGYTTRDFIEAIYDTLPARGKGADRFAMNAPAGG